MLQAKAAVGPPAPESTEAKLHRQPTPGSIAATELRLGVLSPEAVDAVRRGIARAHEADRNGDLAACERALADVQSAIDSDQRSASGNGNGDYSRSAPRGEALLSKERFA